MASENVKDWDLPLSSSETLRNEEVEDEYEEEEVPADLRKREENLKKLQQYVARMAYRPVPPPNVKPYFENLAQPKKLVLIDNYNQFHEVYEPNLRGKRMKRIASKYTAISTEQLEQIIKNQKCRERRKDDLLKKKQEIFYDMLNKLEQQCREQYLNLFIKKFAKFIAKLATTMRIPPELVEPYSRMQRGIFCNILLAVGVQPSNQAAIFYTTQEALEYEVCHKLAHALLSLIIKALDSASTKNPADIKPPETDFEMDNYIKDRLMCAAEKKIHNLRNQKKQSINPLNGLFKNCPPF